MAQKIPNELPSDPAVRRPLDPVDRRLLVALAENADLTFAELGRIAHLSAPATHERVRRLREGGYILGRVARLDPALVGRPLLAFVSIKAMGWCKTHDFLGLAERPEVEEIHATAGEESILLKVRVATPAELEALLEQLHALPQVVATASRIVLSSPLERGPTPR